ncbi:MAG TPA: sigma-70 family RNA polymerase sigma factor [Solirubrobacteraceae bacterium]|jgi:RNA polymerase sigma factor (sigma-70 family)
MASALSPTHFSPASNEHELVALVRNGSDRAFEELYARYRPRISGYIFGMVHDHARAEDIAQEVFISALRRLRQTERPIAFKPWIYEIAKNACIDEFRRARRGREVPLEAPAESNDDDRVLISTAPTPDVAVAGKQSLQDLQGAFHGLSEHHHQVIVMREFEGLSYNQIGEKLGMTRPVVESTLFRARRRLSEEYDELVSGRRCAHAQELIAVDDKQPLLKLGIRQRRQLARHLSHCQPCRREARMAGIDDSLFQAPGIAGKIAALLPIPWLWRRRSGEDRSAAVAASSHSLPSFQSLVQFAGMIAPSTDFGRLAAAAGALAAAIGGGVVVAGASQPPRVTPLPAHIAPAASTSTRSAASATAKATTASATGWTAKRAGISALGKAKAGMVHGGPVGASGAQRAKLGTQAPGAAGTSSAGSSSSTGDHQGSAGPSSSGSAAGSGSHQLRIGGVSVSASSPNASSPSISTPGITAGKVKVPSVTVKLPNLAAPPSAGTQTPSGTPGGPVGQVLKGAGGAVQGATGTLPKVPSPLGH